MTRIVLATAFVAFASGAAFAQPDPSDEDLRFWVKADDLVTAGLTEGDPVQEWVDASEYGTIMSPRREMNPWGPALAADVEEHPHLRYVDINGKSVPTVRFDREGNLFSNAGLGDPDVDDSGAGDRLYQTNNFDDPDTEEVEDPTSIGDGTDLTAFMVFNPDIVDSLNENGTTRMGVIFMFGKRGDSGSLYQLGIEQRPTEPDFGKLLTVNYDQNVKYASDVTPPEKTWQIAALTIEDSDPDDVGIPDLVSLYLGVNGAPIENIGGPLEFIQRNSSESLFDAHTGDPEPFGIGGHSQNCCGEGESFAGNIGEIIIMSKLLAPEDSEWQSIESYLINKYFESDALLGDFNLDGQLDAADLDLMAARLDPNDPTFDLNDDGLVDFADRSVWVHDLKNTYIGDSDLNGVFDSDDFVTVFIAGKYEIDEVAGWAEGDWDGDLRFTSLDFVAAFIDGGYERGPRAAVAAVPEPSSLVLLLLSVVGLCRVRAQKTRVGGI